MYRRSGSTSVLLSSCQVVCVLCALCCLSSQLAAHRLTFLMGIQFLTFVAITLTLGLRLLPRSQALLRPQICNRPRIDCRGCISSLERDWGGSCSMSSAPLTSSTSGPGSIILGSKSFTRKMIVEEMGFAPIIRYSLRSWFIVASHRIIVVETIELRTNMSAR